MTQSRPVVLLVEDEPDVAESYTLWLTDVYDIHRAETGEAALAKLDELAVDVVLLDRILPGMSGDEVLDEIRARDYRCQVAMVSAVQPGSDVVEMGFDGYVTKPPSRAELRETVDRLLDRSTLDEELQEYYSLVARRSALESELSRTERADSDAYQTLVDRIETHRASLDASIPDLTSDTDFVGAVREIDERSATDGERDGDSREPDTE